MAVLFCLLALTAYTIPLNVIYTYAHSAPCHRGTSPRIICTSIVKRKLDCIVI